MLFSAAGNPLLPRLKEVQVNNPILYKKEFQNFYLIYAFLIIIVFICLILLKQPISFIFFGSINKDFTSIFSAICILYIVESQAHLFQLNNIAKDFFRLNIYTQIFKIIFLICTTIIFINFDLDNLLVYVVSISLALSGFLLIVLTQLKFRVLNKYQQIFQLVIFAFIIYFLNSY